MRRFVYIVVAVFCLLGCQKVQGPNASVDGSSIYLAATTEMTVDTRTPYIYTTPNGETGGRLEVAIWASTYGTDRDGYTYRNPAEPLNGKNTGGHVAIHTTAYFDSGNPQLLSEAVYPQSGTNVFFVGLHPQEGWQTNDNTTQAIFVMDGSHDVMVAPRRFGQYASTGDDHVINAPTLNFYHLLTWMKVRIVAEDDNTVTAWGKIRKMELLSNTKVTIDLLDQKVGGVDEVTDGSFDFGACTFSAPGKLNLHTWGTDQIFPSAEGYTMKTTQSSDYQAYVLCAPVDGVATTVVDGQDVEVPEYILHIETDTRVLDLPIDLRKSATEYYVENTRAKHFTLNLNFKMGNTVLVSSQVDDWQFGGIGNVEL